MRRVFVIFLALLFPLNVLALSLSVSSMQQPAGVEHVQAQVHQNAPLDPFIQFADAPCGQSACDIDPDEPPAGTDLSDSVNDAEHVLLVPLPYGPLAPPVPARRGLDPFPPIKPPPSA